jgi:hypothetical protein
LNFRETPLLFAYFEAYHYNYSLPIKMPQNTYEDNLDPATGVYEYVNFIEAYPLSLTCGPHMSSSSFSSCHLPLLSSIRRRRWRAAAARGSARENDKRRKKKMTSGARASVVGRGDAMKHTYSYTPTAGHMSSPYVLCSILLRNEEL